MKAGRLRHKAELQKQVETADGMGGTQLTWERVRDVRCEIRPVSGAQRMESMRRDSSIDHEITARWRDDLTPQHRIVHKGRAFNIKAVMNPDGKEVEAQIIAASGVAT